VPRIGAPGQPELANGSVINGGTPTIVRNVLIQLTGTSNKQFDAICARELGEIERKRKFYLGGRTPQQDPLFYIRHSSLTLRADVAGTASPKRTRNPLFVALSEDAQTLVKVICSLASSCGHSIS
jgi:hypothetical protein